VLVRHGLYFVKTWIVFFYKSAFLRVTPQLNQLERNEKKRGAAVVTEAFVENEVEKILKEMVNTFQTTKQVDKKLMDAVGYKALCDLVSFTSKDKDKSLKSKIETKFKEFAKKFDLKETGEGSNKRMKASPSPPSPVENAEFESLKKHVSNFEVLLAKSDSNLLLKVEEMSSGLTVKVDEVRTKLRNVERDMNTSHALVRTPASDSSESPAIAALQQSHYEMKALHFHRIQELEKKVEKYQHALEVASLADQAPLYIEASDDPAVIEAKQLINSSRKRKAPESNKDRVTNVVKWMMEGSLEFSTGEREIIKTIWKNLDGQTDR
jgi:hypothetical protein